MSDDANWQGFIRKAIEAEASDIHLTVGQRPHMRCFGTLQPMDSRPLTEGFLADFCSVVMSAEQRARLQKDKDIDLSWTFEGRRFRVNAYYQQGYPALALRLLPERIPSLAEIGAPKAWQKMKKLDQGLILVTGRTGSGKTTTLAAFIEELNREKSYHIITLEDPIEYVFQPKDCFISQRELGLDFLSFANALRGALREMPDVVLVGEIRDAQTLSTALSAASAGMLVLGTLHSATAADAMLRMEGLFPLTEQSGLRYLLAEVLQGVFAQRLLPDMQGGRIAVTEVLLANSAVRSLIRQGKYNQMTSVMLSQQAMGMQTLAIAVQQAWQAGRIERNLFDKIAGAAGGEYALSI
ncbi:MAG: PilT/PilU family type 4a pilus ATPase [Selenomonas sp.]|uniref:type IV pilus twitching motility protein PilT n=1 Tax=Selenomonas sp. TaxID=2053611 RepID=UPI0025ED58F4|nr:PilT/PilU family type 4a pilus ATPase [Selenomonas sp.]MCR5757439.1 PilT/PilU family type 4a pilus ATPase [Selenomonas sp.]